MTAVDLSKDVTRPPLDPSNLYAVISLVAALLGLFPVAIVFAVLAFTRPGGRGIAIAGLVLGIVEALAVAAIVYSGSIAFTVPGTATASKDSSMPADLPTITSPPPATAAPNTTVDEITTFDASEVTEAPAPVPMLDGDCDPSVDNHATAPDGTFLKCTYAGGPRARWVRSEPIIGTASDGDPCYPPVTGIAVSPEGRDLFCVSNFFDDGGTWRRAE
ncbi:DUF4190 domain-containing protein [Rhodococcus sp. NPDC049939]|uniref:DUF4190 domain-containing protein n=1 Tax=Rhodococcus sp. NPDC049939 TaxID=3155511 RepID=UPI0033EDC0BF